MAPPRARAAHWSIAALLAVTAALYAYSLNHAPPYLGGDEAHFGIHGHALAHSGRNLGGAFLPLFVNLWDPLADQSEKGLKRRWYSPMLFYVTAAYLTVAPLNEVTVRLPMALIAGVVSPLLLYLLAWQILKRRDAALLAALLLAWSPSNLILGRQALDYLLPLPFILGWLYYLAVFLEKGGRSRPFVGGLLLGVGFYSYIASWIFMPLCLALGAVTYRRAGRGDWLNASLVSAAGFALPLLPLVPWFLTHPELLGDTFQRYQAPDGGAVAWLNYTAPFLNYVSFFNPQLLFVTGGPVPTTSLGRAGVFLLPVAALVPSGVLALLKRGLPSGMGFVLVAGVLLSPVPAIAAGEAQMIQRVMFLLPFMILIACAGFVRLWTSPSRLLRAAVVLLIAMLPLQFAYVYRDYFTNYQHRSAFYYDPVAFRDVATFVLDTEAASAVPQVYFSRDLDDAGAKWRFYTTMHNRQDLLPRTQYVDVDSAALRDAPLASLLVMYDATAPLNALLDTHRWRMVKNVRDLDGRSAALILQRVAAP